VGDTPDSGVDSTTGEWTPAFPGQREPFKKGHTLSMVHGANSPRRFGPLAEQLEHQARTSEGWPPHLDNPMYRSSIKALFRAEARIELLTDFLNQFDGVQGVEDAMSERVHTEEEEDETYTGKKRVTMTKRVSSAMERLHREETLAMNLRSKLGLDPLSFSRIQADVARTSVDLTKLWSDDADDS